MWRESLVNKVFIKLQLQVLFYYAKHCMNWLQHNHLLIFVGSLVLASVHNFFAWQSEQKLYPHDLARFIALPHVKPSTPHTTTQLSVYCHYCTFLYILYFMCTILEVHYKCTFSNFMIFYYTKSYYIASEK